MVLGLDIGSGTRKFARLTFDAPLDKLGIRATRLKVEGGVQQTRVRDPLTGAMRDWSGFHHAWDWSMELRRDLKRWSYGINFSRQARSTFFRIDEIDSFSNNRPYGTAFVELRPDKRTTLRLDLDNVIETSAERYRQFFDPNRTVALPFAAELRHRDSHFGATFSINRTFGGGGAAPG